MTGLRLLTVTAALVVTTLAPSCRLFRKSKPAAPPPPAPAPVKPAPVRKEKPKPAVLPPPPVIEPQNPDLEEQEPPPSQPAEALPPRPRKPRSVRSRAREATEPAEQAPAQPAQQPEESLGVPQLEPMLTPEQRQTYMEVIDANIARAQRTIEIVQGRRLTAEQKTDLARIREFIDQAKQARKEDLFRAKNLSERASILAEDLNRSVQ
ncbi:MAG TPA: hypothetical protein VHA11_12820 [Bryobacteraceae bacterium]|nr:hypothetical protein [Bryobacteraceae bacterium]